VVFQTVPGTALRAFHSLIGENDVLAYLVMMAPRLVALHRVLKPTGSLYLHCDPTASHYLKVLLDSIFGSVNFRGEITWKRSTTHSDAK
jgi:adenine specific DNA methylase Mod